MLIAKKVFFSIKKIFFFIFPFYLIFLYKITHAKNRINIKSYVKPDFEEEKKEKSEEVNKNRKDDIKKDSDKKKDDEEKKKKDDEEEDEDESEEPENEEEEQKSNNKNLNFKVPTINNRIKKKDNKLFPVYETKKANGQLNRSISNLNKAINYLTFEIDQNKKELIEIKEILDKEVKKSSQKYWNWYYRGIVYSKLVKHDLTIDNNGISNLSIALDSFKRSVKIGSKDEELNTMVKSNIKELYKKYIDIGLKLYKMESYDQALDNFEIAKSINKDFPEAYIYIASTIYKRPNLDKKDDHEIAIELYKKHITLGGQKDAAYYVIATFLENEGRFQESLKIINKGIKKNTFCTSLIYKKMNILKKLNMLKKYEKNLLKNSYLSKAAKYYHLSIMYRILGKKEKLGSLLQKSVKYSSHIFETQKSLGIYYFNKAAILSKKLNIEKTKEISKMLSNQNSKNEIKISTKKKIKKRKKKEVSTETKLKKYLKFAKKRFSEAYKIKGNKFCKKKIRFIENYLKEMDTKKTKNKSLKTNII